MIACAMAPSPEGGPERESPAMTATRRTLAAALFGLAGLVPGVALAQSDAASQELMRRLRGAPGSRVGGATRGLRRDDATTGGTQTPAPRPQQSAAAGRRSNAD